MSQQIIFTNQVEHALAMAVAEGKPNRVFVLTDENTQRLVLPQLNIDATPITIAAGDSHKGLDSLQQVWQALQQGGATRQSVLVNLGGGVVTDLGGFAAATFKRGIRFVNVPTTLLCAVDAAVGGKTGINYGGLKNEIGAFAEASHVIISTRFLDTLPPEEFKSGFAEMVKHALLSDEREFNSLLEIDFKNLDLEALLSRLQTSVTVKQRIVNEDPHEHGLRRALNLGHTVGHAFESHAMAHGKTIAHGFAVAWGLVAEGVLSHMLLKWDSTALQRLARFVRDNYGAYHITCDDYDMLLNFMHHDKKGRQGEIDCTLLSQAGQPHVGMTIDDSDMKTALDIYRDLMGI